MLNLLQAAYSRPLRFVEVGGSSLLQDRLYPHNQNFSPFLKSLVVTQKRKRNPRLIPLVDQRTSLLGDANLPQRIRLTKLTTQSRFPLLLDGTAKPLSFAVRFPGLVNSFQQLFGRFEGATFCPASSVSACTTQRDGIAERNEVDRPSLASQNTSARVHRYPSVYFRSLTM